MNTPKSWASTYYELATEFDRWARYRNARINYAVDNLRGKRAVTLTYQHTGEPEIRLTMDTHPTAEDNLRVLYLAVEALRMNEVRGIADTIRAAYLMLPAPVNERDPYEVLGLRPDSSPVLIEASYKALAKVYHPDSGSAPDPAAMTELNNAYTRLKEK
jgi:hypothetical protein